jgi:Mn2+/Fe2+ NRAMP family transporter
VLAGGYSLFERVMSACIAAMFAVVVVTAGFFWPGTAEVGLGLLVPRIPDIDGSGLGWTVALMGGIGGTVTVLCYGYWIREQGRVGIRDLRVCRIDLAVGYAMTCAFGIAMVIIGSRVPIEGSGAGLIVALADHLEGPLGLAGRWAFLLGAFGAVFTSLLGVWQAVPYLFAELYRLVRGRSAPVDTRSTPYRVCLFAIAAVPMLGLLVSFERVQKVYAVVGAAFMPMLALALLVMNSRADWVGNARSRLLGTAAVLVTLGLFGWIALRSWR